MGWFDRVRGGRGAGGRWRGRTLRPRGRRAPTSPTSSSSSPTRRGVEGYVEPRTAVTETTIVLVAADGEWTRRRIDGPDVGPAARPQDLAIPVYDAPGHRLPAADARVDRAPRRPDTALAADERAQRSSASASIGGEDGAHGDAGAALGRVAARRGRC